MQKHTKQQQDSRQTRLLVRGLVGVSLLLMAASFWPEGGAGDDTAPSTAGAPSAKAVVVPKGPGGASKRRRKVGTKFFFDTTSMAQYCCHHGNEGGCGVICVKGLPGYHMFEIWRIGNLTEPEDLEEGLPPLPELYDSDDFKSRCAPLPGLQYFPRLDHPPTFPDIVPYDTCEGGSGGQQWSLVAEGIANGAVDAKSFLGRTSWLFERFRPFATKAGSDASPQKVKFAVVGEAVEIPAFCVHDDGTIHFMGASEPPSLPTSTEVGARLLEAGNRATSVNGAAVGTAVLMAVGGTAGNAATFADVDIQNQRFGVASEIASKLEASSAAGSSAADPIALVAMTQIETFADAMRLAMLDVKGTLHTEIGFTSFYQPLNVPVAVVNPVGKTVRVADMPSGDVGKATETYTAGVWNYAIRQLFAAAKELRAYRAAHHHRQLSEYKPDLEPWKPAPQSKTPTKEEAEVLMTAADLGVVADDVLFEARAKFYLRHHFTTALRAPQQKNSGSESDRTQMCFAKGVVITKGLLDGGKGKTQPLCSVRSQLEAGRQRALQCFTNKTRGSSSSSIKQQVAKADADAEHPIFGEGVAARLNTAYSKASETNANLVGTGSTEKKSVGDATSAESKAARELQDAYDRLLMSQLEAHPIRVYVPLRSQGGSPAPTIHLLHEHFVRLSKDTERHVTFTFNEGVSKERGAQLRRYQHADIVFGQDSVDMHAVSYVRSSAMVVELEVLTSADASKNTVKSPAATAAFARGVGYVNIPAHTIREADDPSAPLKASILTLDETRRAISLGVCTWLATNAVRLDKPFLLPFWCRRDATEELAAAAATAKSSSSAAGSKRSFLSYLFGGNGAADNAGTLTSDTIARAGERSTPFGFAYPLCQALYPTMQRAVSQKDLDAIQQQCAYGITGSVTMGISSDAQRRNAKNNPAVGPPQTEGERPSSVSTLAVTAVSPSSYAFEALKGIMESFLLTPRTEAYEFARLVVYGGSSARTVMSRKTGNAKSTPEVAKNRPLCGVTPMFAPSATLTESSSYQQQPPTPVEGSLECLRMMLSYMLSSASRPHTPYRITAELEEQAAVEGTRSGNKIPEMHPPLIEPFMTDAFAELCGRFPIPPIKDIAVRETMVRWVATTFEKDILGSMGSPPAGTKRGAITTDGNGRLYDSGHFSYGNPLTAKCPR